MVTDSLRQDVNTFNPNIRLGLLVTMLNSGFFIAFRPVVGG